MPDRLRKTLAAGLLAAVVGPTACASVAPSEPSEPTQEIPMSHAQRDRAAVIKTLETIASGADLHQWDAVSASLASEVELDYGTPERLTPEQIIARWRPLLSAFDATEHALSDVEVTVEGDHASARSRFRAMHHLRGAPGGELWALAGRYEHELARGPAGWKVTRMRMIPGESSGNTGLLEVAQERARRAPAAALEGAALRDRNRAVARAFFARLEAFDIEGFAALFAPEGAQIMPFSPEGFPRRLVGREAIFNQYRGMPQNFTSMRFPDLVIHDLVDPARFFATYRGEISLRAGGHYNNTYAGLFLVRDGKIVEFQEYFDPIVLQRAFGVELGSSFNVKRQ